MRYAFGSLAAEPDAIAPDGSEIRFVQATDRASVVHCTLPPGDVTLAVRHRTVEEIWFFLGGEGEIWRQSESGEEVLRVAPGISLTIPLGVAFQFRALGDAPLTFLIATIPPWPGADEAVRVADHWEPRRDAVPGTVEIPPSDGEQT